MLKISQYFVNNCDGNLLAVSRSNPEEIVMAQSMITRVEALHHPDLEGVSVYPMSGSPKRGKCQEVLVCVGADGNIPLHTHKTDAEMLIVGGSGQVLSEDPASNGKEVARGSCVFFQARKAHGFKAGPDGLTFLSRNGGIVDERSDWDIAFA